MSNGESREVPSGLLPPDMKVETRESRETQKTPEQARQPAAEKPAAEDQQFGPAPATKAAVARAAKDPQLMKVERILEENLGDVYFNLPAGVRARFKAKGEETAVTLRSMVEAARATARGVLQLIKTWLKIIPGVNKFYLDQEAKIKTDKIMLMVEEKKREKELQI